MTETLPQTEAPVQEDIMCILQQIKRITPKESIMNIIGSCFADEIELYNITDEELKENLQALYLIEVERKGRMEIFI